VVEEFIEMPLSQWVLKQDTGPDAAVYITIQEDKSVVDKMNKISAGMSSLP
jgi:hypothetical protein